MKLYTQTDKRWNYDIMTGFDDMPIIKEEEAVKRWGHELNDYFGRWGCLITSLCNIQKYRGVEMTPKNLNTLLRLNEGYKYLKLKDNCPQKQESFAVWDTILKLIGARAVKFNVDKKYIEIKNPLKFYIARIPFNPPKIMSGHYNIILGNNPIMHFDSDTGEVRDDWQDNKYYSVLEITF